jgi:hypothetical protein
MYDRAMFCMINDYEKVSSAIISPASSDFNNTDLFTCSDNCEVKIATKREVHGPVFAQYGSSEYMAC